MGYIEITTFADSKVVDEFKKLMPLLSNQNAIIIDLRQNGGGSSRYAHEITKYFTDKKYFYGEQGSTRKHLASHKAWGAFNDEEYTKRLGFKVWKNAYLDYYKDNVWELEKKEAIVNDITGEKLLMPLVILISNNTASAAEDFLIGMRYLERATFIGQKTYGSTGQPIFFALPNEGSFRICTRKCTYPDGKKFVGIGIIPDIEIEPNLNYYISGEDIVLKKATVYLLNERNNR
jgi:C-terminal processing protease CtpA/Prc